MKSSVLPSSAGCSMTKCQYDVIPPPQMAQLLAGYEVSPPERILSEMRAEMERRLEAALAREPPQLLTSEMESFRSLLVGMCSYLLTVESDQQLRQVEQDLVQTAAPLLGAPGAGQLTDEVSTETETETGVGGDGRREWVEPRRRRRRQTD